MGANDNKLTLDYSVVVRLSALGVSLCKENARMMAGVTPGSGGCWKWPRHTMPNGYGQTQYGDRVISAHRAVLCMVTGATMDIPMDACHRCDNRGCVNPDHLFWCTRLTNMRDCMAKGRTKKSHKPSKESASVAEMLITKG